MQVILLERVEKLGQIGDVVTVKPGFARNYLLPRAKALRATNANKAAFEAQRVQLEADNLKRSDEAKSIGEKMEGLIISLIRQAGEAGQLFGSVNARDIAASVTAAGYSVVRGQIGLSEPVKYLGLFEVSIKLHPEVSTTITVNVARSEEEAKIQAETGYAMQSSDEVEAAEAAAEIEAVFEAGAADAAAEELAADQADAEADAEAEPQADAETAE
ncbi:MAG: 50S ribosomal protein L9 [Magnetovibrio sp.]|nr:50S ribosomal protein L9 [Magnetovibrio sp.]